MRATCDHARMRSNDDRKRSRATCNTRAIDNATHQTQMSKNQSQSKHVAKIENVNVNVNENDDAKRRDEIAQLLQQLRETSRDQRNAKKSIRRKLRARNYYISRQTQNVAQTQNVKTT